MGHSRCKKSWHGITVGDRKVPGYESFTECVLIIRIFKVRPGYWKIEELENPEAKIHLNISKITSLLVKYFVRFG